MTARRGGFAPRVAAGLAILASGCGTGLDRPPAPPLPTPESPRVARPNIVVVVTDDMDNSLVASMPTLVAQLAERGATFVNAFTTDPVCGPSRASLLTGRYPHNHGMLENKPPTGGYRAFVDKGNEASTIAVWLAAAGYRTALIGKYLNRYPGQKDLTRVPPGWLEWQAVFFPETYDEYRMNENGRVRKYGGSDADYQTDVLQAKALAFLRAGSREQPFFLYLAPSAPHAPSEPASRHQDLFPEARAPRPPAFNEENVGDKPAWVRALPRLSPEAVKAADDWQRRRMQTLQAVDEMLAALLSELESSGRLERTFVWFTSDNGFLLGAHRLDRGKDAPYEDAIRVPLMLRGPGVSPGIRLEELALNIDLAPTFAELAGAAIPTSVDGRSLAGLIGAQPTPPREWRRDFLVEHWQTGKQRRKEVPDPEEDTAIPDYAALRTVDGLYVEYPDSGERELYDLNADPGQLESRHNATSARELKRLSDRLAALRRCAGLTCRN